MISVLACKLPPVPVRSPEADMAELVLLSNSLSRSRQVGEGMGGKIRMARLNARPAPQEILFALFFGFCGAECTYSRLFLSWERPPVVKQQGEIVSC